jgi:hypothetical protein
LCRIIQMASRWIPHVQFIESTIAYGLPSISKLIPVHTRSELVKKLTLCGVDHIYTGNLNCNGPLFGTREVLLDAKDFNYGERTLGASILTPTMVRSFLSSGADELVIPIDLRFPFSVESSILFNDSIHLARSNGHTVRIHVDGIGETSDTEFRLLVEHFSRLGMTHLSIVDSDGLCTPSYLSVLLDSIRDLVAKDKIALGFQDHVLNGLSNVYTGIEEGITTFHTSLGGVGSYISTLKFIQFMKEQHYSIPSIQVSKLRETERWWREQL